MASYNPLNNQGGINLQSTVNNPGLFSKLLRNLSSFGMEYQSMISRNTIGVNINEDPSASQNSMYDFMSQKAVSKVLTKKSIPYLDRVYADKKRILREYSIKDEIRNFLATIADECIVYDDNEDFCSPRPLGNEYSQDIRDKYQEYFEKIYYRYGFSDGVSAWNMMRDFLIDGYLAVEIVWDDKKKNIIDFNRIKPESIVPGFEQGIGNLWIQFPEDPTLRRIFLDSQIILISYSTQHDYSETSYVEGLIKPFNQVKIIEQTRIMFNVVNAMVYQKFTIPIKGLNKSKAEEQIGQLIANYSEDVEWDDTLGTLSINGSKHLPYNKQIWFPDGDGGTPSMELISPQGHNLNEDSILDWFMKVLKRASKIPGQRFDEQTGGGTLIISPENMTRDEIAFHNFISRLRSIYKEMIVKPIKLQMCMEYPELRNDEIFLNQVDIVFNSNQLFEEWKELQNLEKRAQIMTTMVGITKADGSPYYHIEFLVDEIMKITPEKKEENRAYWIKDKNKTGGNAAQEGSGENMMTGGGDMGGGGSSDFGSDMSGGGDMGGTETPPAEGGEGSTPTPPTPPTPPGGESGGEFEF